MAGWQMPYIPQLIRSGMHGGAFVIGRQGRTISQRRSFTNTAIWGRTLAWPLGLQTFAMPVVFSARIRARWTAKT